MLVIQNRAVNTIQAREHQRKPTTQKCGKYVNALLTIDSRLHVGTTSLNGITVFTVKYYY